MSKYLSRRDFVKNTVLAAASLPLIQSSFAEGQQDTPSKPKFMPTKPNTLTWLDGSTPALQNGTAFGVPWPKGKHAKETEFQMIDSQKKNIPVQTWVTATWPDGSIKWTGHAVSGAEAASDYYQIRPGKPASPQTKVQVRQANGDVHVDTGKMKCLISGKGENLIASIERDGSKVLENGRLKGSKQDSPEAGSPRTPFTSDISDIEVEQDGPIRAVIKIEGTHMETDGRRWLPFSVRLYFHSNSDAIRMVHTFVFDGDENQEFISSLGVNFEVPMHDELYNRHVRLSGQGNGIWAEAIQGLTGLRRDPGEEVRKAQIEGKAVPSPSTWDRRVSSRIHWIPRWSDYKLSQLSANGFKVEKRTKKGHSWIPAGQGPRSSGTGYIGGASGGVAFGMRDFWKLHPTQIDIRNAATDKAEVTMWMWSPDAQPMDIRFYHDGMGQEVEGPLSDVEPVDGVEPSVPDSPYAKQLDALNITYEDYEPGFGTPYGVARSTDLFFVACGETPSKSFLGNFAESVEQPPQLTVQPKDFHNAGVFSNMWGLPDRSTKKLSDLEERLDWSIQYYNDQVDQHHWYGFWDYGDFMHTYDTDRHMWRYDVGGYAWDNSELSTDMWLWYTFLRSGDVKAYRLAEAMNRHNRDVDIYHLGRFARLGTRHNVQHWGCSAKQLRISTNMNRRFHYFLTTDERTGDVLHEMLEADRQLANINPVRKLPGQPFNVEDSRMSVGTDFGSAAANWLTEWERTGDPKVRGWIEQAMRSIGESKWGFFTGSFAYDVDTKKMTEPENPQPSASHLNTMFGLPELCAELIELIDVPEFKEAWLNYCRLYNAPQEVQQAELGNQYRDPGFVQSHSRITAYAAAMTNDEQLAKRAVPELLGDEWGVHANAPRMEKTLSTTRIEGPEVLNPVDEAPWVSTNDSAQFGLAAIQVSALVGEYVK
ncbi:Tat pathway signal sequence domain protein [Rhodohalobacter sp. SW132]|uniref:exo-rhamnogalacturonan lyase family protein n=1 Tax=Rhodohalobacter sp. SW132 TaxID=2293433 RepID=UPI000E280490|nr:Tat pathway signal sequence domain protein [Rhodohalobacter sp. SW132]REL38165.1 Tat pathway signal sequence domain protein [Rhodohalobacter sp. SW132]